MGEPASSCRQPRSVCGRYCSIVVCQGMVRVLPWWYRHTCTLNMVTGHLCKGKGALGWIWSGTAKGCHSQGPLHHSQICNLYVSLTLSLTLTISITCALFGLVPLQGLQSSELFSLISPKCNLSYYICLHHTFLYELQLTDICMKSFYGVVSTLYVSITACKFS